jgi:hypothetical protein
MECYVCGKKVEGQGYKVLIRNPTGRRKMYYATCCSYECAVKLRQEKLLKSKQH